MKKIAMILTLCMVMSAFSGCGSNNNNEAQNETLAPIQRRERKTIEDLRKTEDTSDTLEKTTAAPSSASEEQVVWIYSENQKEDYPTTLGAYEFARLVKEATNNRINVEVHPNGELGDEKDVVAKVQSGEVALMRVSLAALSNYSPELDVLQLPYLYRDSKHMWKVLNGDVGEQFLKNLADTAQVMGLAWFDAGSRNFYTTNKEIKSPSDLAGLKIRVQDSEIAIDMVKALGAEPVAMGYADVLSALENKTIDGAENSIPSYESTEHYKFAKYYSLDEHTRIPEMLIMNAQLYKDLSADEKVTIKQSALLASELQREEWEKDEKEAEDKIKAAGCTITPIEDNSAFQEAVKTLYEKHGADNLDLIKAIQEDY